MDVEQIREYITDFNKKEIPIFIERKLQISETNKIVSIIGPRRAGKTYFLFQIMKHLLDRGIEKNQMLHLNFEDTRLLNINYQEIREILKMYYQLYPSKNKDFYLFIDEPQNIDKWEHAVRSLHDEGIKIFITGSSSKILSKEIATSLRGRGNPYILLPFSFEECLNLKNTVYDSKKLGTKDKSNLLRAIEDYIDFGGFPEILKEEDINEKLKLLSNYFELVVYKDMMERHKLKNSNLIKWLLKSIISSSAKEISINKIYNTLKSQGVKASKNTLYSYLSLLEDAFFAFPLHKFSYSDRKKDWSSNKIYINDTGFVKLIETSKDLGRKMENIVFLEMFRNKKPLEDINYWKTMQQEEVDFVISRFKKVEQLIQVCYDPSNRDTKNRELRALIKASKELKCNNLFVITFDYEGEEIFEWFGIKKKIKFIPIWKWLLDKK